MLEVKVLSNKDFDSLPKHITKGSDISWSLGFADPSTGKAYVRYTGIHDLNKYLVNHEIEELLQETSTHEDSNGIRHKGFWDMFTGGGGGGGGGGQAQEPEYSSYVPYTPPISTRLNANYYNAPSVSPVSQTGVGQNVVSSLNQGMGTMNRVLSAEDEARRRGNVYGGLQF